MRPTHGVLGWWSLYGFIGLSPRLLPSTPEDGTPASSSRATCGSWLAAAPVFLGHSFVAVLVRLARSVIAPSVYLFGLPSGTSHINTLLCIGYVGKASRNSRVRPTEGASSAAE